ncbi:uncharacterized protein PADG_11610 [Paracoccidioides brasiliensis Pb18]|uniref:Uncharacterized protein n=1 Tax=Paracoccidioides brasiliensis (strain Pb18) TaxID=502780 RepID=A0A0A0HWG1_PARBD|nr:uncharacterized protein PADG_11610 [Paracoccidioides brasiliensis Pb18]KGM92406.1 hypothetical protein PADG_11610 [Paracoccidioides brasiliensis Pb18]ODH51199.1 hypothetical protein GX48_02626 [Paracoccidioides brasiliensis]
MDRIWAQVTVGTATFPVLPRATLVSPAMMIFSKGRGRSLIVGPGWFLETFSPMSKQWLYLIPVCWLVGLEPGIDAGC